jgi:hypothetical protein
MELKEILFDAKRRIIIIIVSFLNCIQEKNVGRQEMGEWQIFDGVQPCGLVPGSGTPAAGEMKR